MCRSWVATILSWTVCASRYCPRNGRFMTLRLAAGCCGKVRRGQFLIHLSFVPLTINHSRALFVADVIGGANNVQGNDLKLPGYGYGRGREADGFVASLIFQMPGDGDEFAVFAERPNDIRARVDFWILRDAEGALEDGHFFFDGR